MVGVVGVVTIDTVVVVVGVVHEVRVVGYYYVLAAIKCSTSLKSRYIM